MMAVPSGAPAAKSVDSRGVSGRALFGMTIVFLVTYFASRALAEAWAAPTSLRILVALAPAAPLALLLVMFARAVRSMDELHIRVNLEALAIAFPLTLLLLFVLGNLELVIPLNRDDWSYRHVWAIGSMFYFGALAWAWRRYK